MTSDCGQTASQRYRVTICASLKRYVIGLTATPTVDRGQCEMIAPSSSHVAARPKYRPFRAAIASLADSNSKTRSYSTTAIGAVTMDSFVAMPSAQDPTAIAVHLAAPFFPRARIAAYSVNRKNIAISDSLRCVV